jgi:hypothetical protein
VLESSPAGALNLVFSVAPVAHHQHGPPHAHIAVTLNELVEGLRVSVPRQGRQLVVA